MKVSETTKKIPIDLFQNNKTVTPITITDYIDWVDNSNDYDEVLVLPPIQRGFVWKPKQIQDLWDSMLRDMPIGCVMLQKFDKNEKILIGDIRREVIESTKPGYFLMDGQQRSLAIRLGFTKKNIAHHKLWIDFNSAGVNGCLFQFRVTTKAQPFGYSNTGARLSLHERRNAWKHWVKERRIKEDDLFENIKPWKASDKNGEYVFEVNKLWEDIGEIDRWINKHFPKYENYNEKVKKKINEFYNGFFRLNGQWLALILIPKYNERIKSEDFEHDALTMLFERISSSGTRLSPEDLLFSMIKQAWPEAHTLVEDVHEEVGSLMKPTDYVLTAFRLSALLSDGSKNIADKAHPDARFFHRHLYDLLGTDENAGELRELLSEKKLSQAFQVLMRVITYKESDDNGIPKAIFPELDISLIQIILFWIINSQINHETIKKSRNEIISFVLFWLLCAKSSGEREKGSEVVIEELKVVHAVFPGKALYDVLTNRNEEGYSTFLNIINVSNILNTPARTLLRAPNERAKNYFRESSDLYENFSQKIFLLIWLQREYMTEEFSGFDPISGQDEDNVPYDYDHLVPQSNWSSLAGIKSRVNVKENLEPFVNIWTRRALGNSIGNYRILNASDNRSRGDEPLVDGLLKYEAPQYVNESDWKQYCFTPIDDKEIQLWRKASPSNDDALIWNDERIENFQLAVELRVLQLYKSYISDSKISDWL